MNRNREIEIMQKVGQNDFGDIDTMGIEELLFMIQCVRSMQKQSQGWNNNILEELAMYLKKKIKEYICWYLIRSSISELPYVEGDKGFIFTDKQEAERFIFGKKNTFVNLELYLYPIYEENLFSLLKRNGADWVSVNKGKDGLTLEIEQLIDSPFDISEEELALTQFLNRFVFSKETDKENNIEELAALLMNAGTYCALDKNGKIIAEKIRLGEEDFRVTFLFSDKYEYGNMYLPNRYEQVHLGIETFLTNMEESLLIINPNGANVAVGMDLIAALAICQTRR